MLALDRVLLVRRALAVGFTLDELARLLGERDKGGAPCRKVRALVAEKLAGVEEQIIALNALRDELLATLDDWDERLRNSQADARVGLLETLVGKNQPRAGAKKTGQPSQKSNLQKRKVKNEKS